MVQVRIPTPLRKLTGGAEAVQAEGASIAAVVAHLDQQEIPVRRHEADALRVQIERQPEEIDAT